MNALCEALTKEGYATWNIEYRRVGEEGGGWPGTYEDVKQAIQHLAHESEKYSLSIDRTVCVGHSAGGHLAMLAGKDHALFNKINLRGVVSLAGVSDLKRMYEIHNYKHDLFGIDDNPTKDFLKANINEVAENLHEFSPFHQ